MARGDADSPDPAPLSDLTASSFRPVRDRDGLDVEFAAFARQLFRFTAVLFLVIAGVIALRFVQFGLSNVRVAQFCLSLAGAVTLMAPNVISGRHKVLVVTGCLWAISLLGVLQYGLASPALIVLATPVMMAAALVSSRLAYQLLGTTVIGTLALAGLFISGRVQPSHGVPEFSAMPGNWVAVGLAISFTAIFAVHLIRRLRRHWVDANARLVQRHDQVNALIETAPEGIVLQDLASGRFTAVNPRAEALFGMGRDQLVGKLGFQDVCPEVLPDGRAAAPLLRDRFQATGPGDVLSFDWFVQGAQGRLVPCEVSLVRLPEAEGAQMRISLMDQTARQAADDLARLSAMVFETTSEGMAVTDAEGTILTLNPAMERAAGYPAARMMGHCVGGLVEARERPMFLRRLLDPDRDGTAWTGEANMCRADGSTYPGWLSVNTIRDATGQAMRHVVLCRDVTDLHKAQEEILRQANRDFLTGLPNRLALTRQLEEALRRAAENGDQLAVLFVDLDRLKQVNDRRGHAAGDEVLRQVAERLRACLGPADTAARHAGDEFTLLLTGPDIENRAQRVAEQVLVALSRPYLLGRETLSVAASIGIALYPRDARDMAGLLTAADLAMYEAKARGGNGPALYAPEIGRRAQERLQLMEDLPRALRNAEFLLHYQPIVTLADRRVVMAEALVRWNHPELGMLAPDRFLPLAEEARVMPEIGTVVATQATADLPGFKRRFGAEFRISINCSPSEIDAGTGRGQSHLPGRDGRPTAGAVDMLDWAEQLIATLPDDGGMVVEITERALLSPSPQVIRRLQALRAAGVKLALDDFGAGHSSLLYYLNHEFDYLKIDRAFIRNIPTSARATALCGSILDFATRLGGEAIAEGIETEDQCAALLRAGCALGQGYCFARPMAREALLALPRVLGPDAPRAQ